jgi:hypothetical protein
MRKIGRRHLLRGAGVALALPALDAMARRPAPKVRRSVFIYLPNGVNTLDYQITTAGADYALSASLKPLERHRAALTPVSGLHHPHGLGHHHNCIKIWLTGGRLGPSDRNTISVDQLMAQGTAPHTRFPSLELSVQGGGLAWNADGIQLPAQSSPGVVFKELFEDPKGGIAAQRRGLQRRGSILDTVIDEAKSLDGRLGAEDRGRLEQYLTSVREVEVRTRRADAWLDTPRPAVDPATASRLTRGVSLQQLGEVLRTMYDLIVLAFQTDLTRVVTFSTGGEGSGPPIPEIGIRQDRHSLSHHGGHPDRLRELTQADVFNAEQLAYFLDRLAEVRDAEGPLLDTTMALYGSGMAYGHSHGNANLPLLLAGGGKLGLRHGRHVDYNAAVAGFAYDLASPGKHYGICHKPVNPKGLMSNLLLTMAQRMGVETGRFGDSTGALSELT